MGTHGVRGGREGRGRTALTGDGLGGDLDPGGPGTGLAAMAPGGARPGARDLQAPQRRAHPPSLPAAVPPSAAALLPRIRGEAVGNGSTTRRGTWRGGGRPPAEDGLAHLTAGAFAPAAPRASEGGGVSPSPSPGSATARGRLTGCGCAPVPALPVGWPVPGPEGGAPARFCAFDPAMAAPSGRAPLRVPRGRVRTGFGGGRGRGEGVGRRFVEKRGGFSRISSAPLGGPGPCALSERQQ